MKSIREMVEGKVVRFVQYRDGLLWYVTEDGFAFPVPATDAEGTTLKAEDKAVLFMRWIRKQVEAIKNDTGAAAGA